MKTILVDAWNTFITKEGIYKELHNLLETYPNKKIILTNANEEEKIKLGIVNMPYEVYSLSHNPNKTDPEYFKKMLNHFNLTNNEVIYIEHNPEAVKSAQSVGIKSFNYNKETKELKGVKEFLDNNL